VHSSSVVPGKCKLDVLGAADLEADPSHRKSEQQPRTRDYNRNMSTVTVCLAFSFVSDLVLRG
jgi:hypothetical protein